MAKSQRTLTAVAVSILSTEWWEIGHVLIEFLDAVEHLGYSFLANVCSFSNCMRCPRRRQRTEFFTEMAQAS
jgi:hypothetical protein